MFYKTYYAMPQDDFDVISSDINSLNILARALKTSTGFIQKINKYIMLCLYKFYGLRKRRIL